MRPSPELPIETERLILRPFSRGDVDAVYAYRQRQDVARFLFDNPMSRETCAEAVQERIRQVSLAEEDDRITLAVERREGGDLIGEITIIWRSVTDRQGEVGYILNPDFHGQGYATEAVRALVDLGFRDLDLHRIYARCNPANVASYKLMERLGMRREAHFREHRLVKGSWEDEYVYAILAAAWPSG
ncbi:MAG: GNAT family protein [Devosia sp.]|nr:GNAT family protein [Devosia sp.]